MIPDNPEELQLIFREMKENLKDKKTHSLNFRKKALQKLIQGYNNMRPQFDEALNKDLGYNKFMSNFAAHSISLHQMQFTKKHFERWSLNVPVDTPITIGVASSQIQYQPLGLTLVISPWNYPIYCALPPVAASISAGNSVILKPSQMAPYTSNALKKLFDKYMDKRYYRCIQGQVTVAQKISTLPFDMIFFTGSPQTGRLVAIEAAKNLTPCLLQLGGKCPTIVDESANISNAVLRVMFGKFLNCGQTCLGVDHVYVHASIREKFKKQLLTKMKEAYGDKKLSTSGNYPKIINQKHFDRLSSYLTQQHKGQVIFKGDQNRGERFLGPVIIQSPSKDSFMMKEQIFGPILPIIYYTDINQIISEINERSKPLAVYCFSSNEKNIDLIKKSTSSGAFVTNDAVIHALNPQLPFGGVGRSGYGRYHGKDGFFACSNQRSICNTKPINMYPLSNRFPPYTESKQKQMTFLLKLGDITYHGLGKFFKLAILAVAGFGLYKYRMNQPRPRI